MPETRAIGGSPPAAPVRSPRAGGLTMLDATALVTGGAVASVHFRDFDEEIAGLGLAGWALLVPAFAWLALTAAGPSVFLVRRFSRRPEGYPGPYDWLWLGFGLPWLVAGLFRSASGGLTDEAASRYAEFLFVALAGAAIPALLRLWRSFSRAEPSTGPGHVSPTAPQPASWTARVGRAIAVLWPLQFGLGLLVTK